MIKAFKNNSYQRTKLKKLMSAQKIAKAYAKICFDAISVTVKMDKVYQLVKIYASILADGSKCKVDIEKLAKKITRQQKNSGIKTVEANLEVKKLHNVMPKINMETKKVEVVNKENMLNYLYLAYAINSKVFEIISQEILEVIKKEICLENIKNSLEQK